MAPGPVRVLLQALPGPAQVLATQRRTPPVKPQGQEGIALGMLFSETGVTSVIERSERMGTMLAVEEINEAGGVGGQPLRLVARDPQSRPALFRRMAEELITEHGVRVISGCYMSSTRKALIPVVERWNALLLYPTLYEGFEFSPNVIYTGAAPNQNSVHLSEYMLREHGSRVFLVGSDYIYPYESNRIMSDLVLERGGEKVAEQYLALDARAEEYAAVARRVRALQPDFVFSTVVGDGTGLLHRALRAEGVDPYRIPVASLTTCEAEVQQMGAHLAEGSITCAAYFQSLDSARNAAFVARCRERFGPDTVTNMCLEAAYFQVHLLADAMRRVGSGDTAALLRALPGAEFEAPQGRVRIDEHNHHTYLHSRIGQVNARGQFDILEEASTWVRPDPYLVSHSLRDWSVRTVAPARRD